MGLWSRLRKTVAGENHTAEIQEELQSHLEMDAASGHDTRDAHLRLGNPAPIAEEPGPWRSSNGWTLLYGTRVMDHGSLAALPS